MRQPQDRVVRRAMRTPARAAFAVAALMTLVLGLVLGAGRAEQEDGPDRVLAAAFDVAGTVDVD